MKKSTRSKPLKPLVIDAIKSFGFRHPEARQVSLAGSFGDWAQIPMAEVEPGHWVKELNLPPGRHEYRFLVDGRWEDDPSATEVVPNPYGSQNAIVIVPLLENGNQTGQFLQDS